MSRSIALVGMMGAGKTTIARRLARQLGREVVDTDAEVVRAAGRAVADIFAEAGEEEFRRLERDAVASAAERDDVVVALGGGAVLDDRNVAQLRERCMLVELRVAPKILATRAGAGRPRNRRPVRPLLDVADPAARLAEIAVERAPRYAAVADHSVDADAPARKVVDAILAWATTRTDVLSDAERARLGG